MPYVRIETNAAKVASNVVGLANRLDPEVLRPAVDQLADEAFIQYQKTVFTWEHAVRFYKIPLRFKNGRGWMVGTNDKIYTYVDLGTRTRDIVPRSAPYLQFQAGYWPRTTPRILGSGEKVRHGPFVRTMLVRRHRIEPRRFTEEIQKRIDRLTPKIVTGHVLRWLRGFNR